MGRVVNGMKFRYFLILLAVCFLCSFSSLFAAFHFYFLASGIRPLIIDEPNIYLARAEFILSVSIAIMGFVGMYVLTRITKR